MNICLIYTSKFELNDIPWNLGEIYYLGNDSFEAVNSLKEIVSNSNSEYCLFIDLDKYEIPSVKVIGDIITNRSGEIWHVGNKIKELQDKPILYNYFQPTWIYNLTVSNEIDLTSWKLSGDCFLAKSQIILQLDLRKYSFSNILSWGLDLGYRCLKNGAVVRYCADLSKIKQHDSLQINSFDEAVFLKRNIGTKWLLWCLLRHSLRTANVINCFKSYLFVKNLNFNQEFEVTRDFETEFKLTSLPKIAVFTPTLYRYSYLQEELKQLRVQTIVPNKIIITDQTNEEDRDNSWLEGYKDLNILYHPQNEKGQCNAWNYCLINSIDSDYVLFLGDDADEIYPKFIEDLYNTLIKFKADVVGCNIKEGIFSYPFKQKSVFVTDTFPICLVKRDVFLKSGGYDYAYNRGIRADADVAIRIVLNGGLMVLNPEVKLHHHRAPIGGLRHHKQRKVTNSVSRNSIWKFQLPAFTEIYQHKRYFSRLQQKEALIIKVFSLLSFNGNVGKKFLNSISLILQSPILIYRYSKIKKAAKELEINHPKIQVIH